MHPQPMQVDTRRPGAKLAAPLDDTYYLEISYSRKIFDWSVNVRKALEGIPYLAVPGSLANNSSFTRRKVDINQVPAKF
jgi:hypothetical protein